MKKLLLLLTAFITFSCSRDDIATPSEETGFIPARFYGNWKLVNSSPLQKAELRANKLYAEGSNEIVLKTSGVITEDNGTTMCKIDLGNNERVILLLNIGDVDDSSDDIIGISVFRGNSLVVNGYWVRE